MLELTDKDVEWRKEFFADLQDYVNRRRIEMPAPVLIGKPVDLYRMYKSVNERGGYSQVLKDNSWKFIFLDATPNETYSTNTGYYTRLAYEKSIMDFDKSRQSPFPRVNRKDEERMKKRHFGGGSGGSPQSTRAVSASASAQDSGSKSAGSSSSEPDESGIHNNDDGGDGMSSIANGDDSDSDIDQDELETVLKYDYSDVNMVLAQEPPPPPPSLIPHSDMTSSDESEHDSVIPASEDREKWFETCEDTLKSMQKHYRLLHRYLNKIDKKLGLRDQSDTAAESGVSGADDDDIGNQSSDSSEIVISIPEYTPELQPIQDEEQEQEEASEELEMERPTRKRTATINQPASQESSTAAAKRKRNRRI